MTALDEATGIALRTVRGFLRGRARRDGIVDDRSGALVIIQRFGGALNLNVHSMPLVLDVVCAVEGSGVAFHPMRRLTRDDVADVVARIIGVTVAPFWTVFAIAESPPFSRPRRPVRAFPAHRLTACARPRDGLKL